MSFNKIKKGPIIANSNLNVAGTGTFNNMITALSSFNVSGNTMMVGPVTMSSSLSISGATTTNSTLNIAGVLTAASSSILSGATTIASTLNVSGASTFSSTLNIAGAMTGNTSILSGASTLGSTINITGALTAASTSVFSGASTRGSTLNVIGATTIVSTLNVSGVTTIGSASIASNSLIVNGAVNQSQIVTSSTTGGATMYFTTPTASAYMGICSASYGGTYYAGNLFLQSPANIAFNVNGNVGSTLPAMYITTAGNVGIGTATPGKQFVVYGNGTALLAVGNNNLEIIGSDASISSSWSTITSNNSGTSTYGTSTYGRLGRLSVNYNASLGGTGTASYWRDWGIDNNGNFFITSNQSSTQNLGLTGSGNVYTSGNMGIGMTNPSYKLDVTGDINFTGTLYKSGVAFSSGTTSQWTTTGNNIYYTTTSIINGEYVQFDLGTSNIIRTYSTYSDNNGSYPIYTWALVGSNDPTGTYNIVDNHTSGDKWGGNSLNTWVNFTTSQTTAYRYYRLIFLTFGGGYLVPTLFAIKDTNGSTISVSSITLSSTFPTGGAGFYINTEYNQRNYFLSIPTYGSSGATYIGSTSTTISSTGNVGIGNTAPQFTLHVGSDASAGTIATGTLRLQPNNNANGAYGFNISAVDNGSNGHNLTFNGKVGASFNEVMRITNAGLVGIGNTNPGYPLAIASSNSVNIELNRTGSSTYYGAGIMYTLTSGSFKGNYVYAFGGATTIASSAQSQAYGYYGIDLANAGIFSTDSSYYTSAYFFIDTAKSCFPYTNVGIGTNNPSFKLHVYGNTNGGVEQYNQNASSGSSAYCLIGCRNNTPSQVVLFINSTTRTDDGGASVATLRNDAGSLRLQASGASTSGNIFIVASSGLVGIATTSPSYNLDINGTFRNIGGGRICIQNGTDGGSTYGIYYWNLGDTNWVGYMGTSGAGRSSSGGTACTGAFGFTAHAIRNRVCNSTTQGFIWENSSETCLMSLRGDGAGGGMTGSWGVNTLSPGYTLDVNGNCRIVSGDNSKTYYGPNSTWGGALYVGAGTNSLAGQTAQVIVTNGNLHLDCGTAGRNIYLNYYTTQVYGASAGIESYGTFNQRSGDMNITNSLTAANVTGTQVYTNDWFRVNSGGGLHWQTYGYGIQNPGNGSGTYGNISTYGTGKNTWSGYDIQGRFTFMANGDNWGVHDTSYGWAINGWRSSRFGINRSVDSSCASLNIYTNNYIYYTGQGSNSNAAIRITAPSSAFWSIGIEDGYNSNMYFIANTIYGSGAAVVGFIENDNYGTRLINFTGQHRCVYDNTITSNDSEGLVVCASGQIFSLLPDNYDNTSQIDHITIDEALPQVSLTIKAYQPSVFGVVSYTEDTNNTRVGGVGRFKSVYMNPDGEKQRVFINSVGEGAVWVCNQSGQFTNGDYITSSDVPGYGMKQNNSVMMNYTIGKITIDCDFTAPMMPVKTIKKKPTTVEKKPVTIEKEIEKEQTVIELDNVTGRYIQKTIKTLSKETTNVEDEYDLYDENEKVIGKHKVQRFEYVQGFENDLDMNGMIQWIDSGETKPKYKTRYLKSDGTIITKDIYDMMKLNGDIVYIAAFVSCTYHCG